VLTLEYLVIHVTFESGSEKYKELERGVFVGAGRFILDRGGLGVEYKVSRVGWRP
jgi:RNA polymerase I-specific transcription initiation factor RRN6